MDSSAMNLFAQAIKDYQQGSHEPLYFTVSGHRHQKEIKRYFRSCDELSDLEKKLVSLAKGKVFDVGCANGYYFSCFQNQLNVDSVTGIDISPTLVELGKQKNNDIFVGDIFTFQPQQRYDTVTLLESNIGLGGDIIKTKQLIKKLEQLLEPNGQILFYASKATGDDKFGIADIKVNYKGQTDKFQWIYFSPQYIQQLFKDQGLELEIIKETDDEYLGRAK
jgi:2-polyprenyl-3-methyl-5-hydroxy-6-metoxy-1,4-benzoquinol methylase